MSQLRLANVCSRTHPSTQTAMGRHDEDPRWPRMDRIHPAQCLKFSISKAPSGTWLVLESQGLAAGLFCSRTAAILFEARTRRAAKKGLGDA